MADAYNEPFWTTLAPVAIVGVAAQTFIAMTGGSAYLRSLRHSGFPTVAESLRIMQWSAKVRSGEIPLPSEEELKAELSGYPDESQARRLLRRVLVLQLFGVVALVAYVTQVVLVFVSLVSIAGRVDHVKPGVMVAIQTIVLLVAPLLLWGTEVAKRHLPAPVGPRKPPAKDYADQVSPPTE